VLTKQHSRLTDYGQRLFGVLHIDVVNLMLQLENFFRLDLYISCLTLDMNRQHTRNTQTAHKTHTALTTSANYLRQRGGYVSGPVILPSTVRQWQSVDRSTQFQLSRTRHSKLTVACPDGWCIMTREFGREWRMPGLPAVNRSEAILAAWPTHHVATGGKTYCIVS